MNPTINSVSAVPLRGRTGSGHIRNRILMYTWAVIRFVLIFGLAFLILKPFIIKILNGLMTPDDFLDPTVKLIPRNFSLYYFQQAWKGLKVPVAGVNSMILSVTVALLQVLVCTMIGYGLARFHFKGRNLAFFLVILMMLVPPQTLNISQYLRFRFFDILGMRFNLIDTLFPVYILSLTGLGLKNGLYIYLMRQFFRGLPRELEQAAYIDGAPPVRAFFSVMLPNARTMMATVFLFSFCWQWTDVMYPQMFFNRFELLPMMIPELKIYISFPFHDPLGTSIIKNVGCIIVLIPLIVIFIAFQKMLVKSISRTGTAN